MALYFNGNSPDAVVYNGNNCDKVVYNGVTVWEAWKYKSGKIEIAELSTSSSADWFNTNTYTFSTPIIPINVYCWFSYNYGTDEEHQGSTSCGGGMSYTCADGTTSAASGAPQFGVGISVTGRPSSGTSSKTTTCGDDAVAWFKTHGGIVSCTYGAGGGGCHGTQSCGSYIQNYYQKGN